MQYCQPFYIYIPHIYIDDITQLATATPNTHIGGHKTFLQSPAKESKSKIRLGQEYQASLSNLGDLESECNGELLWDPNKISEQDVEQLYGRVTKKWNLNDRSKMDVFSKLHEFDYNIDKTLNYYENISTIRNYPEDDWTECDKFLFDASVQSNIYNKDFFEMQHLFKRRTIGELVEFYHWWKKHQPKSCEDLMESTKKDQKTLEKNKESKRIRRRPTRFNSVSRNYKELHSDHLMFYEVSVDGEMDWHELHKIKKRKNKSLPKTEMEEIKKNDNVNPQSEIQIELSKEKERIESILVTDETLYDGQNDFEDVISGFLDL